MARHYGHLYCNVRKEIVSTKRGDQNLSDTCEHFSLDPRYQGALAMDKIRRKTRGDRPSRTGSCTFCRESCALSKNKP